jgi:iron complex outermembrane receptor protein
VSRFDANAFSGRAGLVYQPMPHLDVYGSWANSFTPLNMPNPDGSTLKPETGSQWEVGQRTRFLNDRMQASVAAYDIHRQNVPFGRPGGIVIQAGEIRSRGFELDLETSVAANWRLNLGYAYTDSEFLDYEEFPGVNRRGNTTLFAPKNTLNLWTGYQWRNGFGVNVGTRYFGQVFADSGNVFAVNGYGLLNLAAHYRRGPLEFAVNLNNVTDTTYYVPHQDYLQVYPGQPFNVLATVRARFH